MLIGVRWGIRGLAAADVIATYLLAVPTTYLSLKGSPVTMRIFGATAGSARRCERGYGTYGHTASALVTTS